MKGMRHMRYYGFEPTLIIGAVVTILIIILIAYAVTRRGFGSKGTSGKMNHGDDPMDVLNRRYANGEISDEEYEKKKKMMGG